MLNWSAFGDILLCHTITQFSFKWFNWQLAELIGYLVQSGNPNLIFTALHDFMVSICLWFVISGSAESEGIIVRSILYTWCAVCLIRWVVKPCQGNLDQNETWDQWTFSRMWFIYQGIKYIFPRISGRTWNFEGKCTLHS